MIMCVYSGNCRQGTCGQKTSLIDVQGQPLFVGDIVALNTVGSGEVKGVHGLTVVCSDEWTSYSNGEHRRERGDTFTHFVMGIKDTDFMKDDSEWQVTKVKSSSDCINGEYWKDYGFHYRLEGLAPEQASGEGK